VVGIVAARLKEATNRPAVVIGLDGAEGKGSGRSIAGVDLGAAVQRLAAEGLLIKGGGHRMAAGLTVARDGIEAAMTRLSDLLARQGAGAGGVADLRLDGVLMPTAATPDLVTDMDRAGPYGQGASAPRFALPDMVVSYAKQLGEKHLKVTLSDGLSTRIEAIAFGAFDGPHETALGPAVMGHDGRRLHVAGRLELNDWGGKRRLQLRLDDAAFVPR
jgi:single-stranded-DNA-specific exonuclease